MVTSSIFWYCETNSFRRKIVILLPPLPHPPIHKDFRYPKLSEAQKGSSTKTFGTVRHEVTDGNNRDTRPLFPFSYQQPFRYRKFAETQHRNVLLQNGPVL